MKTTIAHIIIERLNHSKNKITFPESFNGDLVKEHNWALFSPEGPKLMSSYPKLWNNVCEEIDYAIAEGVAHFSDTGVITITEGKI